MTRKPGLTLDQHTALGLELAQMHDRLTVISTIISNAYPKNATVVHQSGRAIGHIDQLRSQLDNRLAIEHPVSFDTHIYYPSRDQHFGHWDI